MAISFSSGQVLEHCALNNMVLAAKGWGVLDNPDSTSLAVSERASGGANMSVDVAIGKCLIDGDTESEAGITNVVIEAAHATLYRKDLITYDASADAPAVVKGGNHAGGTADPIYPPDVPAGDILLAIVDVDKTVTTIVNTDITDYRIFMPYVYTLTSSTTLKKSNDSLDTVSVTSPAKYKEFTIPDGIVAGTLRISYETRVFTSAWIKSQVYRNGYRVGALAHNASSSYVKYEEEIPGWHAGDTLELWAYVDASQSYIKEFRAYGDYVKIPLQTSAPTW